MSEIKLEIPVMKTLENGETLMYFVRKCHCGPKLRDGRPGERCILCGGKIPEEKP